MLSDKVIRQAFTSSLRKAKGKPKYIIEELPICNGGARADVVALYDYPHSFEIKSDKDRLDRLPNQVNYYDYTFKKNSVITTEKYACKVEKIIPEHWGVLIVYKNKDDTLFFKKSRPSRVNKNWVGDMALFTLWKQELLNLSKTLLEDSIPSNLSRAHIVQKLHSETNKRDLQKAFFSQLNKRYSDTSRA